MRHDLDVLFVFGISFNFLLHNVVSRPPASAQTNLKFLNFNIFDIQGRDERPDSEPVFLFDVEDF